jgi:hypothetical protein
MVIEAIESGQIFCAWFIKNMIHTVRTVKMHRRNNCKSVNLLTPIKKCLLSFNNQCRRYIVNKKKIYIERCWETILRDNFFSLLRKYFFHELKFLFLEINICFSKRQKKVIYPPTHAWNTFNFPQKITLIRRNKQRSRA